MFTTFLTQNDVLIILHLIIDNPSTGNLQRTVRHIIDKGPVVTHQNDGTRRLRQELFQPLYRLNIQMVGRLVKQQHIRFLKQDLRQFDTHSPTARELRGRTFKVCAQESESHQRPFYLRLIVLSPQHHIAFVLSGIFLNQRQITFALVVRTLRQFLVHLVDARFHLGDVGKGLLSLFTHRCIVLQDHHLRQIAYPTVSRHTHIASRRPLLSTEYFQHRRLACAVLTHQGNTIAVVDDETCIHEQGLHPKLHFQSFY